MTNSPPVQVSYSKQFERDVKQLHKKYRSIRHNLEDLIAQLEHGDTPGDQIQGVTHIVYKVRVRNSDFMRQERRIPRHLLCAN